MKIYVKNATKIQLNWLVAQIESEPLSAVIVGYVTGKGRPAGKYNPCGDWSQGGPIIEQHWAKLTRYIYLQFGDDWANRMRVEGRSTLEVFMLHYVTNKLGVAVEIPHELEGV